MRPPKAAWAGRVLADPPDRADGCEHADDGDVGDVGAGLVGAVEGVEHGDDEGETERDKKGQEG
jgi:hypothetical protein